MPDPTTTTESTPTASPVASKPPPIVVDLPSLQAVAITPLTEDDSEGFSFPKKKKQHPRPALKQPTANKGNQPQNGVLCMCVYVCVCVCMCVMCVLC